jgi:hypothetical protein
MFLCQVFELFVESKVSDVEHHSKVKIPIALYVGAGAFEVTSTITVSSTPNSANSYITLLVQRQL